MYRFVMELSSFDDRLDKIGLVLMSTVEAKNDSVKTYGIGEDLPINLFCWYGPKLRVILQLNFETQRLDHKERFRMITDALAIVRKGWGIDSVTMVAEGYCSNDPDRTSGMDLSKAFVDESLGVSECITIAHVENGFVTFLVKPYTYGVPRTVLWGEDEYYPGASIVRGQNAMYPNMLHRIVSTIEPERDILDSETFYETLLTGLNRSGFNCQSFD